MAIKKMVEPTAKKSGIQSNKSGQKPMNQMFTGKQANTNYVLNKISLVREQPKYAKGAITQKAKNNI